MTVAVRLNTYSGLRAMPVTSNQGRGENAVYLFAEPPLGGTSIIVTASAQTVSGIAPGGTTILAVEVQKGNVVHYRVTQANTTPVAATTSDATIEGKTNVDFGPGYSISLLLAGGEA